MKISIRIILINFVVVVLIMGSSVIAFYSVLYQTLSSQKSNSLISSANNFIYAYRNKILEAEDELLSIISNNINDVFRYRYLRTNSLDFVLEVNADQPEKIVKYSISTDINFSKTHRNLRQFLKYNPYAIGAEYQTPDGRLFYYGLNLNERLLEKFSEKINSDVAIILNGTPTDVSNSSLNSQYLYVLSEASEFLSGKNNFEVFSQGTESSDILATLYKPVDNQTLNKELSFLIFTKMGEAAELRSTFKDIFLVVGITGIALSLILTFLFTTKLRKQITDLSDATEKTKTGDFKNKIKVRSKDEIGKLGQAFNVMLDELAKNQKAKNEYSEFISLINQNPSLGEISEAALNKIIITCNFVIGALYLIEENGLSLLSAYGYKNKKNIKKEEFGFYDILVRDKEIIEINSSDELPVVSAGLTSFRMKYLLLIPVVYNNNIISILELGSIEKPTEEVKEYLQKIGEQLAIGLTNARTLMQLENFVNDLKKLNEEYLIQNDSLVELHNELKDQAKQLEIQKQKAEESTELKSQFLASMSHELRTPMNSILGLTELILEKADLNDKDHERLEVVFNSGQRLMALINDILDLSKIEAGKMEIRAEDVLLEELINEVSSSVSPLVINKKIEFEVERKINTRTLINTDRGRIVQVLINLLGNAVKFTETGEVKLVIYSSQNKLKFDVVDTGIGISEEHRKVIFEEFRQADGSTSRKYGGTGLGLSICRKIADLLDGKLTVESKLGKGSIFTFTTPLKFVSAGEKEEVKVVNTQTLIKNRKHPILIIDDNDEVRYTIGQYLMSNGYEVIFAKDGLSGLQIAVEKQPFAITLDLMMPNKDGWSVLEDLKENDATKDIPVILISINGDKQIGYGLGAFEFFVKPISSDKLLSAFSRLENLANKQIKKIIIVDDDGQEFEKFKREFRDDNVVIEYIKDSELAFSKIVEVRPDLVILDLMMPKIDGITLSYKLKSDVRTKHIPLLISTAKDLSEEERNSLNNIVEEIAVKSKGHPLDVLKVVRDRIQQHEKCSQFQEADNTNEYKANSDFIEIDAKNIQNNALGKVLLVDDDQDTLFTIDEMAKACNCETILATNGVECIQVLEKTIPDLILLDIMMPEMDGFQTIERIRRNSEWKNIPVVAVTARAMMNDKDIIIKHGFDDYISKPVKSSVITSKIQQFLTKIKVKL
jgi:signal transduction histidine kinase/CheY-like chemotaxis protein/HAMP domain-containing protein